jgi:hypothetical protein
MTETPKGVLELLEQLRQERSELDSLIRGLEKRLGIVSEPTDSDISTLSSPRVKVSIDSVPVGFFHNMSQADAAEKLLRLNPGHPLSTNEMLEAFRKSGMQVNPKNSVSILYTTLKRNSKFERVAGKKWGLAEWYPNKKRRPEDGAQNDG